MKDKIGIFLGIGIAIAVIVTLSFFAMNAGTIDVSEIAFMGIVLVLVVSVFYILWDRIKNVQKGLPAKDERVIMTSYKAGYYGFIAAIWSSVGGPLLSDIFFDHELEGHYVTAIVVLVSGIVFIASYLFLTQKGDTV
jgi:hypothetical protein